MHGKSPSHQSRYEGNDPVTIKVNISKESGKKALDRCLEMGMTESHRIKKHDVFGIECTIVYLKTTEDGAAHAWREMKYWGCIS